MSSPAADDTPLDPAAAKMVARIKWLMLISGVTTLVAIAAVLGVIGYRIFKAEGSVTTAEVTATRLDRIETPFPNGESYLDVVARTRELLGGLMRERDGERVLVIAHSANRWAIQHLLHAKPLAEVIEAPFEWLPGWEYVLDERAATIL